MHRHSRARVSRRKGAEVGRATKPGPTWRAPGRLRKRQRTSPKVVAGPAISHVSVGATVGDDTEAVSQTGLTTDATTDGLDSAELIQDLCPTCTAMIQRIYETGHSSERWVWNPFEYHRNVEDMVASIAKGCVLCTYLEKTIGRITIAPFNRSRSLINSLGPNEDRCRGYWLVVIEDNAENKFLFNLCLWKPEALTPLRKMRIPDYDLVTSSSSEPCMALINRWIDLCRRSHQCERNRDPSLDGWMPTRLVYCGPQGPLRIQESADFKSVERYMTLSHCWGKSKNPLCLKSKSLARWKLRLPNMERMKTFRDAIAIAQACGVSYIWIDSLCIVQDSEQDWARESSFMELIYKFSYCNISATSAKGDTEGCFFPRIATTQSISFNATVASSQKRETAELGTFNFTRVDMDRENEYRLGAVNTRGWVLQERVMSPRIIHLCRQQLFWECDHLTASESFPTGWLDTNDSQEGTRIQLFNTPKSYYRSSMLPIPLQKWLDVRAAYSTTNLSVRSDKLIAVSAIAREIQKQLQCRYLAGVFETHVLYQLCWSIRQPESERGNEAPSWSWASVMTGLEPRRLKANGTPLAEYKDAQIDLRDGDEFGRVSGGAMSIDCLLFSVDFYDSMPCVFRGPSGFYRMNLSLSLDFRRTSTLGLFYVPLWCQPDRRSEYWLIFGLALELLQPGVYCRVGFIEGAVSTSSLEYEGGSTQWVKDLIGTYDGKNRPIAPHKNKWQTIRVV